MRVDKDIVPYLSHTHMAAAHAHKRATFDIWRRTINIAKRKHARAVKHRVSSLLRRHLNAWKRAHDALRTQDLSRKLQQRGLKHEKLNHKYRDLLAESVEEKTLHQAQRARHQILDAEVKELREKCACMETFVERALKFTRTHTPRACLTELEEVHAYMDTFEKKELKDVLKASSISIKDLPRLLLHSKTLVQTCRLYVKTLVRDRAKRDAPRDALSAIRRRGCSAGRCGDSGHIDSRRCSTCAALLHGTCLVDTNSWIGA